MTSYRNLTTIAGLSLIFFSIIVDVEDITTTTASGQGSGVSRSQDVTKTPPQGRRLPEDRNPLQRTGLEVPSIDYLRRLLPECSHPYGDQPILSYQASPGPDGSKIQRVRVNAVHRDNSIRVIYDQSAPPGKPWAVAKGSAISDAAANIDTVAYVLTVWNVKGGAVSRRVQFGYTLPFRFRLVNDNVSESMRPDGGYQYSVQYRGENIKEVHVSVRGIISDRGYDAGLARIQRTSSDRDGEEGLIYFDPPGDRRRYRFDFDVKFNYLALRRESPHCLSSPGTENGFLRAARSPGKGSGGGSGGSGSGGGGTPHYPMEVCRGSAVPSGYILVNDEWVSTRCGNPTTITYNVWILHYYADLPVGGTKEVCSDAPTPAGWSELSRTWDGTRCGHPTSSSINNVKTIRRNR